MAKVISIHSFRSGSGKSYITANLATILAAAGQRVGIIDSDVDSPAIHHLFGVQIQALQHSLNDYLWGNCEIKETAFDLTPQLNITVKGQIFLIPFTTSQDVVNYDIGLLSDSFHLLMQQLALDVLLIDTKYGVNRDVLPSIAFSDTQLLVLRLSEEYFEGTGVAIDLADELGIDEMVLLVNQVPDSYDLQHVKHQIEQTYQRPVVAVLPYKPEIAQSAHEPLFVIRYPKDPLTVLLTHVAATLTA